VKNLDRNQTGNVAGMLLYAKTTIKNVSLKSMRNVPIPLPPFEEQKRIVAKIEELLPYCDQLIK
jgi:restriction endonuclease S subunit